MEQLFSAIPTIVGGMKPPHEVEKAVVFSAWRRSAGAAVVARTEPVGFRNGTLIVAVCDRTWQRNLEELSPQLLGKINAAIDEIVVTFIEFNVAPVSNDTADKMAKELDTIDLNPALMAASESIADDHLRSQFIAAASACLARS